jgi:hypothetical protein
MWRQIIAVAAVLTLYAPGVGAAQSSQPAPDTYQWSAEFVAVDPATRTITVKSRVAYPDALPALQRFKAGDRVWIVWSGIQNYSDAMREVRAAGAGPIKEPLVMPAEIVSPEAPNQYVTIRVRVPEAAVASVQSLKPGEWVTLTSRHQPSSEAETVVSAKPYVASATAISTK